jgi:hypothetical protein
MKVSVRIENGLIVVQYNNERIVLNIIPAIKVIDLVIIVVISFLINITIVPIIKIYFKAFFKIYSMKQQHNKNKTLKK